MTEPVWINEDLCHHLHIQLLSRYGGLDGLREPSLLSSALSRPRQRFSYETKDLHGLAATYAEGIVKNHPFLDGNKRTGFLCAALFLEQNGWKITASEEEAVLQTVALAAGDIQADAYADWLRRNSRAEERPDG